MTWFANILIIIGLWLVGSKRRSAFIFTFAGEAIWTVVSAYRGMYDLAAICALFSLLAMRNWWMWSAPAPTRH